MAKYYIQSPIKLKGKRRAAGTVELTDEQAADLLACGAIVPAAALPASEPTKNAKNAGATAGTGAGTDAGTKE